MDTQLPGACCADRTQKNQQDVDRELCPNLPQSALPQGNARWERFFPQIFENSTRKGVKPQPSPRKRLPVELAAFVGCQRAGKKQEERKQKEKISVLAPFAEKPAFSCSVPLPGLATSPSQYLGSCWGNEVPKEFMFWGGIPPRLPGVFQILGAKRRLPFIWGLPSWALQPARSCFGKGSLRDPLPWLFQLSST